MFLLIAFITQLSNYTLQVVSNDDFVHVTLPEIVSKVGEQEKYVASYHCDGKKELAVFPEFAFSNVRGDSLKVSQGSSPNDEIFTYQKGSFYTSDGTAVDRLEGPFLQAVADAISTLEGTPSGRVLLRHLEHSPYDLVIAHGINHFSPIGLDGTNSGGIYQASTVMFFKTLFYPASYNMIHQIGNGGRIYFDPTGNYSRIESDGKLRATPPYVALAHEMYHAFDSVRGLLDRRFVVGDDYQFTEACEYRAVFLENQIRRESGILYAKYYSETDPAEVVGKPGMLSPLGEPYWIPSACIPSVF